MVVQNENIEKTCCFYVSDFHLEMILLPYIKEKMEENISIITERKLSETIEILMSKMNWNEDIKQKILKLEWDGDEKVKENSNVIIIGSKKYIKEKNEQIENKKLLSILDCYNFEEEQGNMNDIIKNYNNTLNSLGKNNF